MASKGTVFYRNNASVLVDLSVEAISSDGAVVLLEQLECKHKLLTHIAAYSLLISCISGHNFSEGFSGCHTNFLRFLGSFLIRNAAQTDSTCLSGCVHCLTSIQSSLVFCMRVLTILCVERIRTTSVQSWLIPAFFSWYLLLETTQQARIAR